VRVVHGDGTEVISDFVIPSVEDARKVIADGALNGVELLEDSGMSTAEVEAELARIAHAD
jgi:hypothetical protein